jgi:hypothetical protein
MASTFAVLLLISPSKCSNPSVSVQPKSTSSMRSRFSFRRYRA